MPHRYFQDEAGEWRYAVEGDNGENLVTSEGYTRKADAARGYNDLCEQIVKEYHANGKALRDEGRSQPSVGGRSEASEPSNPEDAESSPTLSQEDGSGSGPDGEERGHRAFGSTHDEVPGDNPAALRDGED